MRRARTANRTRKTVMEPKAALTAIATQGLTAISGVGYLVKYWDMFMGRTDGSTGQP